MVDGISANSPQLVYVSAFHYKHVILLSSLVNNLPFPKGGELNEIFLLG